MGREKGRYKVLFAVASFSGDFFFLLLRGGGNFSLNRFFSIPRHGASFGGGGGGGGSWFVSLLLLFIEALKSRLGRGGAGRCRPGQIVSRN